MSNDRYQHAINTLGPRSSQLRDQREADVIRQALRRGIDPSTPQELPRQAGDRDGRTVRSIF